MAVAFRSAGNSGPLSLGTIPLSAPAGVVSTDVVVAVIIYTGGTSSTITAPAGWTQIRKTDSGTTFGAVSFWALGNVASYSFTFSGPGGDEAIGYALAYSGVDNSTPIDTSSGATGTTSTVITASTITTANANEMLLGAFAYYDGGGGTPGTWSAFFGTERVAADSFAGQGTSIDGAFSVPTIGMDCADAIQASPGSSGSKSATESNSNLTVSIAQLIALVPAGAAATPAIGFGKSLGPAKRGPRNPVSSFRSPQPLLAPDPPPPVGSATFWTSRGPRLAFGKGSPWSRFRSTQGTSPPPTVVDEDYTSLCLPAATSRVVSLWGCAPGSAAPASALDDGGSWPTAPVFVSAALAFAAASAPAPRVFADEDPLPPQAHEEDAAPPCAPAPSRWLSVVFRDDDFPPPQASALDEDSAAVVLRVATTRLLLVAACAQAPSSAAVASLDDDVWRAPSPWVSPPCRQAFTDDDPPAGFLFGQPDEDYWRNPAAPVSTSFYQRLPLGDPEEIPAATLFGQLDEDGWTNLVPPLAAVIYQRLPLVDPEELPAASLRGVPEEDYWQSVLSISTPRVILLPVSVASTASASSPTATLDEDPWTVRLPAPTPLLLLPVWDDDPPAGNLYGVPTEDQVWPHRLALSAPRIVATWPGSQAPAAAVQSGSVVDDEYSNRGLAAPPQAFASVLVFGRPAITADDETISGPDEDYWIVIPVQGATSVISGFSEQDEVSPSPCVDEDFWGGAPRPIPASFWQRLPFAPDPEEIPANTLRGQPDEDFDWRLLFGPPAPVPATIWQRLPFTASFPDELPQSPGTAPAAPATATFSSPPGQATTGAQQGGLLPWWLWRGVKREEHGQDGFAPAPPGIMYIESAPGGALGGTKQPPVAKLPKRKRTQPKEAIAAAQAGEVQARAAAGGARSEVRVPTRGAGMVAIGALGGARAASVLPTPSSGMRAESGIVEPKGWHGPTWEEIAKALLETDLE